MRGFFIDDKILRFFDFRGNATDWNWETGEQKPAPFTDVGTTPDGKLGVNEHESVHPIEGGRNLLDVPNGVSLRGGAIDPLNRFIAYTQTAYWESQASDFISPGPGKIVVYDVKKLEAAADVYRTLAAYDKEHNLDDNGNPLKK